MFPAFRGVAGRRRAAAQYRRRTLHGAIPPARGAGAARRGGAGDRRRDEAHRSRGTSGSTSRTAGRVPRALSHGSTRPACATVSTSTGDPAPVHPAAHYAMGGVWSDLDGRTTSRGCTPPARSRAPACTGRTGWRATRCSKAGIRRSGGESDAGGAGPSLTAAAPKGRHGRAAPRAVAVEQIAWDYCGIVRDGRRARRAFELSTGSREHAYRGAAYRVLRAGSRGEPRTRISARIFPLQAPNSPGIPRSIKGSDSSSDKRAAGQLRPCALCSWSRPGLSGGGPYAVLWTAPAILLGDADCVGGGVGAVFHGARLRAGNPGMAADAARFAVEAVSHGNSKCRC